MGKICGEIGEDVSGEICGEICGDVSGEILGEVCGEIGAESYHSMQKVEKLSKLTKQWSKSAEVVNFFQKPKTR